LSTDPRPVPDRIVSSDLACRDTAPADPARLVMLDVARLVAAAGVIAAHVIDEFFPGNPAWVFGSFAVPFYLFVAIYFTVRGFSGNDNRAVGPYLRGRVIKLYVPFLLWNVIYDVFHVLYHPGERMTPLWQIAWAAVYTHLYFLPFLLGVTILLGVAVRPLLRSPSRLYIAVAALTVLAIVVACGPQPVWLADLQNITHETLWNFYRAIPSACLAACVALLLARFRIVPRSSAVIAFFGLTLTLACLFLEYRFGQQGLLRAGSGVGVALIAFSTLRASWLAPLAAMGRLSFGVYLSHMLVIRIVVAFAHGFDWPRDARVAVVVGVAALVGGLAISGALASSRWTRWMIGCESPAKRRPAKDLRADAPISPGFEAAT
jgi:peptidoglycan/LPS O-acetylase OafA/YrhL